MRRLTALAAVTAFAVACTEQPASHRIELSAAISDGATGGNPHFFFLPPMVANPGEGEGNDTEQSPVVVICEWNGSACETTLATFTTDIATTTTTHPGNSETVRVNPSHAIVNWHTGNFDLDPALNYRICVSVGDVALGFADVDVVAKGGDKQDVADDFLAVVNGRTLPIKFRIEPGALDEAGGGCGSGDT